MNGGVLILALASFLWIALAAAERARGDTASVPIILAFVTAMVAGMLWK